MAHKNPTVAYEAELQKLREVYTMNTPRARLNVIVKKLSTEETGPARLVTLVSAVEAFARSLAIHLRADGPGALGAEYKKLERKAPEWLVAEVFRLNKKGPPAEVLREDTWELFKLAVGYRNLVVHECTFLGQDKYPSLNKAVEEVLGKLEEVWKEGAGPGKTDR